MANHNVAAKRRASLGLSGGEGEAALRRKIKLLMERNHVLSGESYTERSHHVLVYHWHATA